MTAHRFWLVFDSPDAGLTQTHLTGSGLPICECDATQRNFLFAQGPLRARRLSPRRRGLGGAGPRCGAPHRHDVRAVSRHWAVSGGGLPWLLERARLSS